MKSIRKEILSAGHSKRPGGTYQKTSLTIHSTGNRESSARNERMWLDNPTNRRDASWHYVVDENTILQAIPEAEEAWHAGHSHGNKYSIGVEICESGDRRKTLENAAEFVAGKLKAYGWGTDKIKKHQDWSGKNCPRILIDKAFVVGGMDWNWLVGRAEHYLKGERKMVERRYNTLAEVPDWGKATIKKLIDKGGFADVNKLNLTEDVLRTYVTNDRVGVYK